MSGSGGGTQPLALSSGFHLYTWVDIDRLFAYLGARRASEDGAEKWPRWLREVDAYWHGVRIVVVEGTSDREVWDFLTEVLGPLTVDPEKSVVLLETATPTGGDRSLPVEIERSAEGAESVPRPRWATTRVIPGLSVPLDPSDDTVPGDVAICAFHSFKGGVGRTLHCVAAACALADRGRRVLLVDADLEAPGITWMWQAQSLRVDFTFEDFLALVHGSRDDGFSEAVGLGARFLANQEVDGVVVMPARRDFGRLEPTRIEPVDLLTHDRKPFVLTDALALLAQHLGIDAVLVDLRAGVSELNAPLLLDPRIQRVVVSTISDQSVRGTVRVLRELGTRAPARPGGNDPAVSVLLTQYSERDHQERLERVGSDLVEALMDTLGSDGSEQTEADLSGVAVLRSPFDMQLLNPGATWDEVRAAALGARLDRAVAPIVDAMLSGVDSGEQIPPDRSGKLDDSRRRLQRFARNLVFAEASDSRDFLVTESLSNLAAAHRTEVPIEVVIGAKGSGKTFTFLQLSACKRWSGFVERIGVAGASADAYVVPVIGPANLEDRHREALDRRRDVVSRQLGLGGPAGQVAIRDFLRQVLDAGERSETAWRKVWLACFARSVGLSSVTPDSAQEDLTALARNNRVLFVVDGLEDLFQDFNTEPVQQAALRALLTDCPAWLRTLRQRPLGLLVFVRRDLAQAAVKQNFGQFEGRHRNFALRWNRQEALRLAAWVCQGSDAVAGDLDVATAGPDELTQRMLPVWGDKMGSAKSREARAEQWFIAALSDFSGQIQARDVVFFLEKAAETSLGDTKWSDRILSPTAMREALRECSTRKIADIEQENRPVGELLKKLRDQPSDSRKVPFDLAMVGLDANQADLLVTNGVIFREEDQYWIPEIFRHGLGFKTLRRPRVLSIANLVRRRND